MITQINKFWNNQKLIVKKLKEICFIGNHLMNKFLISKLVCYLTS